MTANENRSWTDTGLRWSRSAGALLETFKDKDRSEDRSFYLAGANGTASESVDRIARGSMRVKNFCLTVLGGIQPSIISSVVEEVVSEKKSDGLLQRFGVLVFPDPLADYDFVDRLPEGIEDARRVFNRLNNLNPADFDFKQLDSKSGGRHYINFDSEAQAFFQVWITGIERQIRSIGTDLPTSHISKFKSLMPKLALIFQLVDLVGEQNTTGRAITLKNAQLAAKWIDFFAEHARRLYANSTRQEYAAAKKILAYLVDGDIAQDFFARDLYRKHWRGLSKPQHVNDALEVLVEYGWLTVTNLSDGNKPKLAYYFDKSRVSEISANRLNSDSDDEIERLEREAIQQEAVQ